MAVAMDVVAEHAEEASFLWHLRETALDGTAHDRASLADLDDRILAHLDGLAIAGDHGWSRCVAQQASRPRRQEAFPFAWLALAVDDPARRASLHGALTEVPALAPAVVAAVAWLPDPARAAATSWLWSWGDAGRAAALAGGLAVRDVPGDLLASALADPSPCVRSIALRAIGACGRRDGLGHCQRRLDGDPGERDAAAWSLALLDGRALEHLEASAASDPVGRAALLRRAAAPRARAWCQAVLAPRDVITAAVERADVGAIEGLLSALEDPRLARHAGWAIGALGGVDPAAAGLIGAPLAGADDGPDDDPDDARVDLDPDRDLPWLDPGRTAAWWSGARAAWPDGGRVLGGTPVAVDACRRLLDEGPHPLRRCAAYELAALTGTGLFPVDAPSHRQRRLEEDGWFR